MKLEGFKNHEENKIGDVTETTAGIDASSMPIVFKIMSKALYSNPIGSIVREITSNCFDSHKEANSDEAVVVRKDTDEEGTYISFNDFGVGLSPERMANVYMKYFTSTKRGTNEQIGGFGLGSKTPLSYTEYFYINTVSDKYSFTYIERVKAPFIPNLLKANLVITPIKYQYLFSEGETLPTLALLDKSETTERNGTEIRVYIKNENDEAKFENEVEKQLCYFDNVIFEGFDIENEYKIYEGETYKYRNTVQYDKNLHIVFGKVSYPIDWTAIEMKPVNIAAGIKFNIGELEVTPSRESIRYTDEIKDKIRTKIQEVIQELTELYNEQNTMFDSFFSWYSKKKERPYVKFSDEDKLYLYGLEDIDKKHQYKHFEGLEFLKEDDILGMLYKYVGDIKEGKPKDNWYMSNVTDFIVESHLPVYISKSPHMTQEKNWLHKRGFVFHEKINKTKFAKSIFRRREYEIKKGEDTGKIARYYEPYFNLGVSKKLYTLLKAIRQEVNRKFYHYNELSLSEINEYREWKRANDKNLQRKLAGKVFVKSISQDKDYEWEVDQINHFTGIVVYGNRDDEKALQMAVTFLAQYRPFRMKYDNGRKSYFVINDKACKVLMISKSNEKYFKNKKNMTHVKDLYSDHILFRRIASSFRIEKFFIRFTNHRGIDAKEFIKQMTKICEPIGNKLDALMKYYKKNSLSSEMTLLRSEYARRELQEPLMEIADKYKLYDPAIESVIEEIEKWFSDVEVLRYTDITPQSLPAILKYLKEKKKKLNPEYYSRNVHKDEPETQLTIVFDEPKFTNITNAA